MNYSSMIVSITALIAKHGKDKSPKYLDVDKGRITPGKTSAWITVLTGVLMTISGVVAGILAFISEQNDESVLVFSLVSLLGLAIAGFMAPSIFSIHDIEWDEKGVTGAKSTFGPTLGWKRHTIRWSEIVNRGETVTQYWYLETQDKRRVYWSYLYPGFGKFDNEIEKYCPGLSNKN